MGSPLAGVEQELVCDWNAEEWQSTNDGCLTPQGDTFDNESEEVKLPSRKPRTEMDDLKV